MTNAFWFLISGNRDNTSKVEQVKTSNQSQRPDVNKAQINTEKIIDDVTNRMCRLETKYEGTVEQRAMFEKRVQELENEMTKEKTERTVDTTTLQARIDTVECDLKAQIRQVASEHTVFEGRFTMTRQPNAVHVGESLLTLSLGVFPAGVFPAGVFPADLSRLGYSRL